MLQDEIVAALRADGRAGLIVDRRERHLEAAALAAGLVLSRVWATETDAAGSRVCLGLLTSPHRARGLPRTIDLSDVSYTRRVDHFYLPAAGDSAVTATLFNVISSIYDDMISRNINLSMAETLLRVVAGSAGSGAKKILDYGCGTGLAFEACKRLGFAGTVALVGTDISQGMLERAQERGERVIPYVEWQMLSPSIWDGTISAFTLHYGLATDDLARIARQLKPKALFAANFIKAGDAELTALRSQLSQAQLTVEAITPSTTADGTDNPILIMRKT